MDYDNITEWIRAENGNLPSADSQVTVAEWFVENEISRGFSKRKRRSEVTENVEPEIEHTAKACLNRLVEIGVLHEYQPPGSGKFIRHDRTESFFFPPFEGTETKLKQLYATEVARFILDLRSREGSPEGTGKAVTDGGELTFREVAANGLGTTPEKVEEGLLETTVPEEAGEEEIREIALDREDIIGDGITKYSSAVSEIAANPNYVFNRDYDDMTWGRSALKYALSEQAHHLEFTHSFDEFTD